MKEEKDVVRYKRTEDKKEFKKQLDKFEQDVQKGKTVCLTDLFVNAETQYIKNLEKEE